MIYTDFQDKKLSLLGFGTMRLPLKEDGSVDYDKTKEMTDYAISQGVNYFDTAWPYHNGESETVIGEILSAYPRDSYYLADKYPGHQILSDGYNPAEIFEEQLLRCKVDYFDFYLLHNVQEVSIKTYMDPRWKIMDYFIEQKRLGRIKHLGFSAHATVKCLTEFLDAYGDEMEFCQIQLNYLDWSVQDAKRKCEILNERNIPIWVMEPVRGGKLANLDEANTAKLKAIEPDKSVASWGFRYLQNIPGVTMILSGMSNMEQMKDNIATFDKRWILSEKETELLYEIAETMKNNIPCTGCRYCCDGCPQGIDIPTLLEIFNEIRVSPAVNATLRVEFLPDDKKPSACINCGQCSLMCPQNINIPELLAEMSDKLAALPKWADICREREEASKKGK